MGPSKPPGWAAQVGFVLPWLGGALLALGRFRGGSGAGGSGSTDSSGGSSLLCSGSSSVSVVDDDTCPAPDSATRMDLGNGRFRACYKMDDILRHKINGQWYDVVLGNLETDDRVVFCDDTVWDS